MFAMLGSPIYRLIDVRAKASLRGRVHPLCDCSVPMPQERHQGQGDAGEVLKASMNKEERETYQQLASEADERRK